MNPTSPSAPPAVEPHPPIGETPRSASSSLPVGDVLIRRDETGYGIFNYRGERVLDLPVGTSAEAERLAAEIVSPWHGHVCFDEPSRGD